MFRVLVLDDNRERLEAFAEALEGCERELEDGRIPVMRVGYSARMLDDLKAWRMVVQVEIQKMRDI